MVKTGRELAIALAALMLGVSFDHGETLATLVMLLVLLPYATCATAVTDAHDWYVERRLRRRWAEIEVEKMLKGEGG